MIFGSKRIIWFTGQPGSGKSVLGSMLKKHLEKNKQKVIIIDGDDLREKTANFDYTQEGRNKNILNAQMIARFLVKSGYIVVVSVVAPYLELREQFKKEFGSLIVEVYVHCSDIRGRESYHVKNYEKPLNNFLSLDTTQDTPKQSFKKILKHMSQFEIWDI